MPLSSRAVRLMSAVAAGVLSSVAAAQTPATPLPKPQVPVDLRIYRAARALENPAQQLAAYRKFLQDYPKSNNASKAQEGILNVLLKSFPARTDEIDTQAMLLIKGDDRGSSSRIEEETDVAMQLADAGTNGVDGKRALQLATEAVEQSAEGPLTKSVAAEWAKAGYAGTPEDLYTFYLHVHCEALAALADAEMDEGELEKASAHAREADALDPRVDDVKAVEGRIALRRNNTAEALDDFEQATLVGDLAKPWRTKMMELYRTAHGGREDSFIANMDLRYAQLYPDTFSTEAHTAAPSGHTVLLELFTGSACPPCVGADLALDAVLKSYGRSEVVALVFDEHIPEPDPLTIPAGVDRADTYRVRGTPTFALDGVMVPAFIGGRRNNTEKAYNDLTALLDQEAVTSSAIKLQLTATTADDGTVMSAATISAGSPEDVRAQAERTVQVDLPLTAAEQPAEAEADAKAKKATATALPAKTSTPSSAAQSSVAQPHLAVNFALVEDGIRYSGENGMRFHRMVVRALAKPTGEDPSVNLGQTTTQHASFDPKAVSRELKTYLTQYETTNTRFGKIEFLSKDTSLQPAHLAVAAWVEDTASHHVLQAAFAPVRPPVAHTMQGGQ